jgi:hypothetical protein
MKLIKRLGLCVLTCTLLAPIALTAAGCDASVDEDGAGVELGDA